MMEILQGMYMYKCMCLIEGCDSKPIDLSLHYYTLCVIWRGPCNPCSTILSLVPSVLPPSQIIEVLRIQFKINVIVYCNTVHM